MTEETMTAPSSATVPWHLWLVGALALLWNGYGAFDYVMTQTNNAAYLANYTEAQRAYFNSFPMWMEVVWALGVWGGLLAAILLLLRRRQAFLAFLVSLVAFVISLIYSQTSGGNEVMGSMGLIMSGVIFLIGLALTMYARAMTKRGVLR